MKVRYTPRAQGDIDKIYEYLDERNSSGAHNVLLAIYAGVQFIVDRPKGSERTENPNVRVKLVRRYQYKIFYSVVGDTVEILHVRHMSRRPWKGEPS
jgi:plasmid stabilization system protein ParE